jgi:thiol-disulfide isomerase/thioredoxin
MRTVFVACLLCVCSVLVTAQEWTKKYTAKDHTESAIFAMLDSMRLAVERSVNSEVGNLSYEDIFTGRRDSLKSLRGKVVMVNVWFIGCPPCVRELPILQRVQSELGKRGFELLAISLDDTAKQRRFLAGKKLRLGGITAMTRDEDCSYPFTMYFNPSAYIVDRRGILRQFWIAPKTYEELISIITQYL